MSPTLLMTVDSVLELRGKPVLLPGVDDDHPHRLLGQTVRIVRPDGTSFRSTVHGVEFPNPNPLRRYPIRLASTSLEHHVPPGSEVWYLGGG